MTPQQHAVITAGVLERLSRLVAAYAAMQAQGIARSSGPPAVEGQGLRLLPVEALSLSFAESAVAMHRDEAAASMSLLADAIGEESPGGTEHVEAAIQWAALIDSAPLSSVAIDTWVSGWQAYAAGDL